jgi:hypothetical protein
MKRMKKSVRFLNSLFMSGAILIMFACDESPSKPVETQVSIDSKKSPLNSPINTGAISGNPISEIGAEKSKSVPFSVPIPNSGKATVTGTVLHSNSGNPIQNIEVRLAEVARNGIEGAYFLDTANSPGSVTNELGQFVMPNIAAREYVIVIGDPYGKNKVIPDRATNKAQVVDIKPDKISDIGVIRVELESN